MATVDVLNEFNGGKVEEAEAKTLAGLAKSYDTPMKEATIHLNGQTADLSTELRDGDFVSIQRKTSKSG